MISNAWNNVNYPTWINQCNFKQPKHTHTYIDAITYIMIYNQV